MDLEKALSNLVFLHLTLAWIALSEFAYPTARTFFMFYTYGDGLSAATQKSTAVIKQWSQNKIRIY